MSSSQSAEAGGGRTSETQILAGFERGAERTSEFTFGHTGHMDIILGRSGEVGHIYFIYTTTPQQHHHTTTPHYIVHIVHIVQVPPSRQSSGIFENIKEKAKHGFSATKRNFL